MKFKKIILLVVTIALITGVVTNYNLISRSQATVDQDKDGLLDSQEDLNGNGILEEGETDPNNPDSDSDGNQDNTDINPLDGNINLFGLPSELDTNNDNKFDINFTDAELLTNFKLQRVTSTDLINNLECNYTNLVIDKTILDCNIKLEAITDPTINYTFGSDSYYVKFDDSLIENPCELDETNQISIICKSINYSDINIDINNLKLYKKDSSNIVEDTTKSINLELTIDDRTIKSKELDSKSDEFLERKCLPQLANSTTTCTIKLPTNTFLTPQYQMGIGVEPGGQCDQLDNSQLVECKEVPVGNIYKSSLVNSTLNQNIKYAAIIAPELDTTHKPKNQKTVKTYTFDQKDNFTTIDKIDHDFQDSLNLIIYNEKGDQIQKIFGFIDDKNNFVAIESVNLSDLLTPGIYNASIKSVGVNNLGVELDYKLLINIINKNLPRTGGLIDNNTLGFLVLLLIILLIYNNKNKTITILIFLTIINSSIMYLPVISIGQVNLANPSTIKDMFGAIDCQEKNIEPYSTTICFIEIKDNSKIDIYSNFVLFYEKNSVANPSKNCTPYNNKKWVCSGMVIKNSGKIEIKIGAVGQKPYQKEIPISSIYDKSINSFIINSQEDTQDYSASVKNLENNYVYESNLDKKLFLTYESSQNIDANMNVYVNIVNSLNGDSVFTSKLNKINPKNFSLDYTPTKSGSMVVKYCIGISPSNCKVKSRFHELDLIPKLTTSNLYEETDKNADKINIVFKCGTDLNVNGKNRCTEYVKPLLAWDGMPKYLNEINQDTTPENAFSIKWGLFSHEPLKSNKNKFNVFVINELDDANFTTYPTIANNLGLNPKNTIFITAVLTNGRSFAKKPLGTYDHTNAKIKKEDYQLLTKNDSGRVFLYLGNNNEMRGENNGVLTHEIGHALFGLGDEYNEPDNKFSQIANPNCQFPKDSKDLWTKMNNGVDPVNSVDSNYYEYIKLLKSTKNTRLNKSLFDMYEASTNSIFNVETYKVKYNNFGGCTGPDDSKDITTPTANSLMRTQMSTPIWGTINRLRIENILSLFSGKTLCNTGTVDNKNCVVTNGCTNLATNATCDNQASIKKSFCPLNSVPDSVLGYCADNDNVYGVFPNALVNKCLKNSKNSNACTNTNSYKINNSYVNLFSYNKKFFKTLRTTASCPYGTVKDSRAGNNCVEFSTKAPKDIKKANVFGPFTAEIINKCLKAIDSNSKGSCYSGRLTYNFFETIK